MTRIVKIDGYIIAQPVKFQVANSVRRRIFSLLRTKCFSMSTKYQQEHLEKEENGNKLQFVTKIVAESSMKFMQKM